MARFFPYDDVVGCELPPIADIQWIAGQISELPAFKSGTAVLCGSTCWGKHSWRSDIDVAHYSTVDHPHLQKEICAVLDQYRERTGNRVIVPNVDVITIGVDAKRPIKDTPSLSAESPSLSAGEVATNETVGKIFADVAVRFADHIGCLAAFKGDPWQAFHQAYLSGVDNSHAARREAIKSYVSATTAAWARQPLHALNLGPTKTFSKAQFDALGQAENYPINLMRRILGELDCYPRPDRAAEVRAAFAKLQQPWAHELLTSFEPFFKLDAAYETLVAECQQPGSPVTADDYQERLRSITAGLPFAQIEEQVWAYLKS